MIDTIKEQAEKFSAISNLTGDLFQTQYEVMKANDPGRAKRIIDSLKHDKIDLRCEIYLSIGGANRMLFFTVDDEGKEEKLFAIDPKHKLAS
jgi:hypothetical protein